MSNVGRIRYSEAFKSKVVKEYECGRYSFSELQKLYGIVGNTTIGKWVRQKSSVTLPLEGRRVIIMGIEEKTEAELLRQRVSQLEKVISDQKIEVIILESILEVASEEYGEEFKKKCLRKLSPEARKSIRIF